MKVSLITPTFQREQFHSRILKCFRSQSHSDIEWLILDDSPTPSKTLAGLECDNIKYYHTHERMLIGDKRNWLAERCSGDFIAHFDDDDFYAKEYISTILSAIDERGLDFLNLRGWFVHDIRSSFFGYWDMTKKTGKHYVCDWAGVSSVDVENEDFLGPTNELGWGFGFFYRKKVWEAIKFPSQNWKEDGIFSVEVHNQFKAGGLMDSTGICLHEVHGKNSSRCFPQYNIPSFFINRVFPDYTEIEAG